MEQSYYIYSIKMRGWLLRSGIYGTDLAQARTLGRSDAIAWCKKHVDHNEAPQHLPVSEDDFRAIVGA